MAGSKPTSPSEPPTEDAKAEQSRESKVHQVLTWILEGNAEQLIRESIQETWPSESVPSLLLEACDSVATSAANSRSFVEDFAIEAMRFLYQKQVEIGEYAGAMRAVESLHKLATAGKIAKTEPKPQPLKVADGTDNKRQRLAERIARIG